MLPSVLDFLLLCRVPRWARELLGLGPSIYWEFSSVHSSSPQFVGVMVLLLSYLISALACTALYPTVGSVSARKIDRKHIRALRQQAADRHSKNRLAVPSAKGGVRLSEGVKNFTFTNPAASGMYLSCGRVSCTCEILGDRVDRV